MNVVLWPHDPEKSTITIHVLADVMAIIFWARGDLAFGLQPEEFVLLLHVLIDAIAAILWLDSRRKVIAIIER